MTPRIAFYLPFFLIACGGADRIRVSLLDTPEPESDISETTEVVFPKLVSLFLLEESPLILSVGEEMFLTLQAMSSEGEVMDVHKAFWFSNNGTVAEVDQGLVTAKNPGTSVIRATVGVKSAELDLIVMDAPEELPAAEVVEAAEEEEPLESPAQEILDTPDPIVTETPFSSADYFLSANDIVTIRYGTNGGFGSHLSPNILYGMPRTGGTHVVSIGGGGRISIQWNNFIIADGPGVDFTIFENPVHSDFYGIFAERARVSVSADGVTYHVFPCDRWDSEEMYEGCAGVWPVNPLNNPLDPEVSGGDSFDLAQLGLQTAKYLRIDDLNTCMPDDPTYLALDGSPLCWAVGQQGFDLDALAILNGINE
ncbi:MAG: hypothetical protein Q7T11_06855 [Deltaproteobacteria bacterium]|nr:hypothetical protein [Deltaproteobacteria bacterium]